MATKCTACGRSSAEDDAFCAACGAQLPQPSAAPPAASAELPHAPQPPHAAGESARARPSNSSAPAAGHKADANEDPLLGCIGTLMSWGTGAFIIALGFSALTDMEHFQPRMLVCLAGIAVGLFLIPPIGAAVERAQGWRLPPAGKTILAVAAIVILPTTEPVNHRRTADAVTTNDTATGDSDNPKSPKPSDRDFAEWKEKVLDLLGTVRSSAEAVTTAGSEGGPVAMIRACAGRRGEVADLKRQLIVYQERAPKDVREITVMMQDLLVEPYDDFLRQCAQGDFDSATRAYKRFSENVTRIAGVIRSAVSDD